MHVCLIKKGGPRRRNPRRASRPRAPARYAEPSGIALVLRWVYADGIVVALLVSTVGLAVWMFKEERIFHTCGCGWCW
jgi:hypothetical protein